MGILFLLSPDLRTDCRISASLNMKLSKQTEDLSLNHILTLIFWEKNFIKTQPCQPYKN